MKLIDIANQKSPSNSKRVVRQKNKRKMKKKSAPVKGKNKNGLLMDQTENPYQSPFLKDVKLY